MPGAGQVHVQVRVQVSVRVRVQMKTGDDRRGSMLLNTPAMFGDLVEDVNGVTRLISYVRLALHYISKSVNRDKCPRTVSCAHTPSVDQEQ